MTTLPEFQVPKISADDVEENKGTFTIEVPRGLYDIGARPRDNQFPAVEHQDQDLIPPLFDLTFEAQP